MSKIVTEVTPLRDSDCFFMKDRYKDYFSYPLHCHGEMELNFVENCRGAMRIVEGSREELQNVDLALIGGHHPHAWEQHRCRSERIREITIQFNPNLFGDCMMSKTAFGPVRTMLETASRGGLAFGLPAIMRVYNKIIELTTMENGLYRMLKFMEVLYDLAQSGSYRELQLTPQNGYAQHDLPVSSADRIAEVRAFIRENYRSELRLADLSAMAGLTPTAFSRCFKTRTGQSVTDYIIDLRLAEASRELVDSRKSVAEICLSCGFNNVSNFNRIFKKKKGTSPNAFRHLYRRQKAIV